MAVFFFLLSLAYLLACLGLGGYSLLGLCIPPLARTQSFAAGQIILTALLLFCAVAVGGLFVASAAMHGVNAKWHGWSSIRGALKALPLLAIMALPFCLC